MRVFQIRYTEFDKPIMEFCYVTKRIWKGQCILCIDDLRDENLPFEVKGFQGFRYRWW